MLLLAPRRERRQATRPKAGADFCGGACHDNTWRSAQIAGHRWQQARLLHSSRRRCGDMMEPKRDTALTCRGHRCSSLLFAYPPPVAIPISRNFLLSASLGRERRTHERAHERRRKRAFLRPCVRGSGGRRQPRARKQNAELYKWRTHTGIAHY